MNWKCKECGSDLKLNGKKIAKAAGTSALFTGFTVAAGLPLSLVGLVGAAIAGRPYASQLLRLKAESWRNGSKDGAYVQCSNCGRDIPLNELL